MKNRSRFEIVFMILDAVRQGDATRTKIMYKAYLSYMQVKEYVSHMEQSALIQYEAGTQVYRITDRGRKLMHLYEEIVEMVSSGQEDGFLKVQV